ncbi:MAG: hypothetical protein K0U78_11615 [Actinomycetia bacterium]|nr:hypothetical protein [Actinomycetes bacterium]MCH9735182.1 hypothetical protein [Actinomycetes bacterium]
MLGGSAFRYAVLVIQFVVLAILARNLTPADYGRYLMMLGVATPAAPLIGLGASESFVLEASKLMHKGESQKVGSLVGATLAVAVGMSIGLAAIGGVLLWLLPFSHTTVVMAGSIISMSIGIGLMLNGAQMLLGIGFEALGAFFQYSAVTFAGLLSSVPYVLLTTTPTFAGVALVNATAVLLLAAVAILPVLWRCSPKRADFATALHLTRVGVRFASMRALGYGSAWFPAFMAGVLLGPAQAAYFGLGFRLAYQAGIPMQMLRFSSRPAIVRAYAQGNYNAIKTTCEGPAAVASGIAIIAIIASAVAGHWIIGIVFGPDLALAAPVMTIVLVGVALDAFGCGVDTVLKMTGYEKLALTIMCACVGIEFVGLMLASHFGVLAMAWVITAFFGTFAAANMIAVRRKLGIWIYLDFRSYAAVAAQVRGKIQRRS